MRPPPIAYRLLALLLAALAACAGPSPGTPADAPADAAPRPARTRASARDLQFAETFEIRFDDELVGYLVDVLDVPSGVLDERAYAPGTALIEGLDLEFLGFISPRGTTYRFRDDGSAEAVGFGTRNRNIAAFFGRNGDPLLTSLHPGTVPTRR